MFCRRVQIVRGSFKNAFLAIKNHLSLTVENVEIVIAIVEVKSGRYTNLTPRKRNTNILNYSLTRAFSESDSLLKRSFWLDETKKSICIKIEFNSQSVSLVQYYGRRSFVLVQKHGHRDVM